MLKRPIQALIHAVDTIADTLDCSQQLRRLLLHALLGGEDLRTVQFMSSKIGPHICGFGSGLGSLLHGFRLGPIHPALNAPPHSGDGTEQTDEEKNLLPRDRPAQGFTPQSFASFSFSAKIWRFVSVVILSSIDGLIARATSQ